MRPPCAAAIALFAGIVTPVAELLGSHYYHFLMGMRLGFMWLVGVEGVLMTNVT